MSSRTLILAVVVILAGGEMAAADVDQAITKLQQFKAGDGTPALNAAVADIRAGMTVGDVALWKRLRVIVENQRTPVRVRAEVLRVAIEKANQEMARDMLGLFSAWTARSEAGSSEADARMALLGQFIGALQADTWHRWLDSDTRTPGMLEHAILNTTPGMDVNHQALAALAASGVPSDARRSVAERVVSASPHSTEFDSRLLGLLDESSCARLRPLVIKSADPDQFHFGGAAALAHLGDKDIRGVLESALPTFQQKDQNRGGILNYYMWQIDVQNPPEKLVDYIGQMPKYDVEKRKWAIRRAVQLGITKPVIREAVLKHASSAIPEKKTGARQGLSSIKELCNELGVLDSSDLPGVAIVQRPPTP